MSPTSLQGGGSILTPLVERTDGPEGHPLLHGGAIGPKVARREAVMAASERIAIVALEEHFVVPELMDAWSHLPDEQQQPSQGFEDEAMTRRLSDLGDQRRAAMKDQGVDVQVLSLTSPGVQSLAPADAVTVARQANDALAELVAADPGHFQAFASIPTPDPQAAAAEMERAMGLPGFRGALLNGRTRERNADAIEYDDLYGVAERLGAPLYLHPQIPVEPVRGAYYSGLGDPLDETLAMGGIGWHYETGVQFLRMVFSGVFDRHPGLQVVLGHWGEVVLFYLERVAPATANGGARLERSIGQVVRENVWVTGSGILSPRYLRWAAEVVGIDRILTATDYPYVDNGDGRARSFLEEAPIDTAARDSIASGAWERLTGHLSGAAQT